MSDPTVRQDLMRVLDDKSKLSQKPLSSNERGAAMAAQTLNAALMGFGDDVSGVIDYLDDVIRGRYPQYDAAVEHAKVLRMRLAQQEPKASGISSAIGGLGLGALPGGVIGTGGGIGAAIVSPIAAAGDPAQGRWKGARDAYGGGRGGDYPRYQKKSGSSQ